ncbi:MAG TPA: hypothetical protein VNX70_13385 [Bryobacteraceae bacterium]|jgi:hypothetical protein|nr:hypothetical protein [Bryobacteraceae bacterium]
MTKVPAEIVEPLDPVLRRLKQVNVHWHEALSMYFEPNRFRIAIQNCITTSRSVTFILQSHKHVIPGFDEWYAPWQSRFGGDPIMRWAVQARNKIEKQGDLETLSQMRFELVVGYAGNPVSNWATVKINCSTDQIRRSIPANLLSQHVIDNGVLSVERRWVDSELPGSEVLDALAHVYGQLALLVVSLHSHLGVPIPQPDRGEHLLWNLREDGRLPSMECPLEERAVYIAVKDGSILGYRREFGRSGPDALKKAQRRYGHFKPPNRLTESSTFMEVAKAYFDIARVVMARDGYHMTMFIPLKGARQIGLVAAQPENRAAKYMLMRDIARYVRRAGADGLLHIGEAWIEPFDDIPRGGYADQATNRLEVLAMTAANEQGQLLSFSAKIERKLVKKHKVKRLGPTEIEEDARSISMAPVLEVWGKLDVLRLHEIEEGLRRSPPSG